MHNIVAADGCYITDANGHRFLDATSQGGLLGLGHNHPLLRAAMSEQLSKLPYMHGRYEFETTIRVGTTELTVSRSTVRDKMLAVASRTMEATQVWFNVSGSSALMTALKACRISKTIREAPRPDRDDILSARKPFPKFAVLSFEGAYHGQLGDAQLLTDCRSSYRIGTAPSMHVKRLPFPYRGMTTARRHSYLNHARQVLDELLDQFGWRVSCLVFESILGFGHLPDPETLTALCAEVRRRGILLVADEFKTGLGRTGVEFACQHFGIQPDVMTFSKILTGGYPCAAIVATDAVTVTQLPPESYWDLGTFIATPMACAAMLATVEIIDIEGLVANAASRGKRMLDQLRAVVGSSPLVADIDGTGLLISLIVHNERVRDELAKALLLEGLLSSPHGLGWGKPLILLMPPLIITESDVDKLVQIVARALNRLQE